MQSTARLKLSVGGKIWKENVFFPLHFAIDPHGDCPAAVKAARGGGEAQAQKFLGHKVPLQLQLKRHFKYDVEPTYLCFPQLLNGGILMVLEELWGKLWGNSVLSSKQFVLRR